jgi:hypothetical protein
LDSWNSLKTVDNEAGCTWRTDFSWFGTGDALRKESEEIVKTKKVVNEWEVALAFKQAKIGLRKIDLQ